MARKIAIAVAVILVSLAVDLALSGGASGRGLLLVWMLMVLAACAAFAAALPSPAPPVPLPVAHREPNAREDPAPARWASMVRDRSPTGRARGAVRILESAPFLREHRAREGAGPGQPSAAGRVGSLEVNRDSHEGV